MRWELKKQRMKKWKIDLDEDLDISSNPSLNLDLMLDLDPDLDLDIDFDIDLNHDLDLNPDLDHFFSLLNCAHVKCKSMTLEAEGRLGCG